MPVMAWCHECRIAEWGSPCRYPLIRSNAIRYDTGLYICMFALTETVVDVIARPFHCDMASPT